ncbi:dienelactone hydrolase family protein [Nonomuraea spiralis]|uniref:Dienelactone hydrolase family protein n=1 Tax=Nonomuraea spiralis TaxID=46182 RepID=A0ABV5I6V9_9ACTN|nr:dienelactone hydrolase family protein [Nonomuraea spiralis]
MNGRITTGWVDIAGMTAYTALPVGVRRPVGVLVAGEIFGVSGYVRRMADRLAGLGHAVVVPDFNHRHGLRAGRSAASGAGGVVPLAVSLTVDPVTGGPKGRVVELPADAAGRERGLELAWLLRREEVLSDAGAALEHLRQVGADPAAAVGFSLGGHVVCSVAGELGLRAAVALYPGWLTGTELPLSRPVPTLELAARAAGLSAGRLVVLLGADDPIIDAGQQRAIAERLETVAFAGAGHGFAADERDSFHADSAREAWKLIEEVLGRAGE